MKTLAEEFDALRVNLPLEIDGTLPHVAWDANGKYPHLTGEAVRLAVPAVNFHDRLVEAVEDMVNSGVEFEDPRLRYKSVQVSCATLRDAAQLLADIAAARQGADDAR